MCLIFCPSASYWSFVHNYSLIFIPFYVSTVFSPLVFLPGRHRVTSGLVVLAKSKEAASNLSTEIRDKSTKKTYLARVKGKFPCRLENFRVLTTEDILKVVMNDDDDDEDDDKKDGTESKQQQQKSGKKRDRNGNPKGLEINESDLPPRVRDIPTFDDVVRSDKVGCSIDTATGDFTLRCPIGMIFTAALYCTLHYANSLCTTPLSLSLNL